MLEQIAAWRKQVREKELVFDSDAAVDTPPQAAEPAPDPDPPDPSPDPTATAMAGIASALGAMAGREPAAPTINVTQAPVTVNTPAVRVDNHLPEQPTPTVDVHVEAVMPEQSPPNVDVRVEAVMPESAPSDVVVNVRNEVPPAEVTVKLPPRKTVTRVTERDGMNNLVTTEQIETDL